LGDGIAVGGSTFMGGAAAASTFSEAAGLMSVASLLFLKKKLAIEYNQSCNHYICIDCTVQCTALTSFALFG
jgi:hypothetical protein